ncbi:outer membrane lipoprotein carrier protein LolA [Novosphingobium piscinae]|uniref:Outer membrane lipoprotein carrier protein LolA n=1 Tax=Novosphingobium piscinae TaxID=1507448 RepID=A0A7X1G069_9SPHN|nr:outer membrane lipoprotein carrier protein LolA [Novosphingobium piscinae]MBC2670248.1 outer membrane lipoprotein carrier protein LolA [Novosphingobium piscinae]
MNSLIVPVRAALGRILSGAAVSAALCLSAPLVGALAGPAPAAAQGATDLDLAVGALRAITTLQADFQQTDRNGQRVAGKLTLKRPGKIRFQYQPGVPLLIVGDGKALTLVDYEVKQVQRWPIRNSPLGALLDPTRDVKRFGTLQPSSDPAIVSIEVRDRGHPEYGVITLIFQRKADAPGGLELVSWVSLDSQNRRTTIRLANQRYGMAVDDNAFRFNDPRPATRR